MVGVIRDDRMGLLGTERGVEEGGKYVVIECLHNV
jgi:hypothetical protein